MNDDRISGTRRLAGEPDFKLTLVLFGSGVLGSFRPRPSFTVGGPRSETVTPAQRYTMGYESLR